MIGAKEVGPWMLINLALGTWLGVTLMTIVAVGFGLGLIAYRLLMLPTRWLEWRR